MVSYRRGEEGREGGRESLNICLHTLIDCSSVFAVIHNGSKSYPFMDFFQSILFCLTNPPKGKCGTN